jgi:hypothetical protein
MHSTTRGESSKTLAKAAGLVGTALVGFTCLTAPGCSARSSAVVATAPPDIGSYTTLAVTVSSSVENTAQETTTLAAEILAQAKASGRFKEVRPAAAKESKARTLLLTANITEVKKVGGKKRFMLGVGAGRAHLLVHVDLKDARTGKPVGSYDVKGESGGSAFSGGTEDAVGKAGAQVVKVVVGSPADGAKNTKDVAASTKRKTN